jgi:hypothetical protein
MNWYYVDNGKQAGPIEDLQLQQLASAGVIQPDTLVWREGMANWQPYIQVAPAGVGAAVPPPMAAPALGPDEVICAECRQVFPRQDTIAYGTVNVCASCKPIFIQKLSEGVHAGARRGRRMLPVDANALIAEIQARGYEFSVLSCISRAWALIKANFWIAFGATFLVLLCNQAAGFVPFIGWIISLVLSGPLMGGLNIFLLKLMRGERAELGDAFSGFSSHFGRLCGTYLLMMLIAIGAVVPGIILLIASIFASRGGGGAPSVLALSLVGVGVLVAVYFGVAFSFAVALAADMQLGAVNALKVSFRVVNMRWFKILWLMIVTGLVNALALLACLFVAGLIFTPFGLALGAKSMFVGIVLGIPAFIMGAVVMMMGYTLSTLYAYEDIFSTAD